MAIQRVLQLTTMKTTGDSVMQQDYMSLYLLPDNRGTVTEVAGTCQVQAAYMKF